MIRKLLTYLRDIISSLNENLRSSIYFEIRWEKEICSMELSVRIFIIVNIKSFFIIVLHNSEENWFVFNFFQAFDEIKFWDFFIFTPWKLWKSSKPSRKSMTSSSEKLLNLNRYWVYFSLSWFRLLKNHPGGPFSLWSLIFEEMNFTDLNKLNRKLLI